MMNTVVNQTVPTIRIRQDITNVKWGDVCYVDFGENIGSEQGGVRPAIIIQNDKGNTYSPTTIVAAITAEDKKYLPTHIKITPNESGLREMSTIMFEQVRTIDKTRILSKVGHIDASFLINKIKKGLTISFGML